MKRPTLAEFIEQGFSVVLTPWQKQVLAEFERRKRERIPMSFRPHTYLGPPSPALTKFIAEAADEMEIETIIGVALNKEIEKT